MAPKVKVGLRQEAPPNDTLFKIFFAAVKIGEPASKRQIANRAKISSQLVDYHIGKLVDSGLLITDETKYMAQEAFFDEGGVMELMEKAVVTESLIESLVGKLIFNQAGGAAEEVIEEAIIACVRLFSVSLRGKAQ